jgi:hypothetical protein
VSYARKGLEGSDVYVWTNGPLWFCQECDLLTGGTYECRSAAAMLAHMRDHRAAGHAVPDAALARLEGESA